MAQAQAPSDFMMILTTVLASIFVKLLIAEYLRVFS
jgi:hypothetical protein